MICPVELAHELSAFVVRLGVEMPEAGMISYPESAVERAMKVQDVMLQAMAKKITWWQAAEILGISDRHMRRWRERYAEFGFPGLFDRRRGRVRPPRVSG